jgi:hypothetical protein
MTQESDEEIISALRAVEVPEPSPLFWDHLSSRVHDALAGEPVPSSGWVGRLIGSWLGGLVAVAALLIIAVTVSVRHGGIDNAGAPAQPVQAKAQNYDVAMAIESLPNDDAWSVMGELASEIDFDQAAAGLTVSPGTVDRAVSDLSADEQRAAIALLRDEIRKSKAL